MPIYEYKCTPCKQKFEVLRSISDTSKQACPTCGKYRTKRLISCPYFKFVGGGFYETDYKRKK